MAMGATPPPPPPVDEPVVLPPPPAANFKPFRPKPMLSFKGDSAKLMLVVAICLRVAILLFAVLAFGTMASVLDEPHWGKDDNFNFMVAAMVLMFVATAGWIVVAVLEIARVLDLRSNASVHFLVTAIAAGSDLVFLLMAVSAASAVAGVANTHYCYHESSWCSRIRASAAFGFLASFSQLAVFLISLIALHKLLAPDPQPQPGPIPVAAQA